MVANAVAGFGFSTLAFTTLYVHRAFGLDSAQAGALMGVPLLAGVIFGGPAAGWLIDRRARRSPRAAVEIAASGLLVAALAALLTFSTTSIAVFEVGLLISLFAQAAGVLGPTVILQNVIKPSLRASAASINLTFGRLVGWAAAPVAVGIVSDLAGRDIRLSLLLLVPPACLVAAGCLAVALGSIRKDVAAMEVGWAAERVHRPASAFELNPGQEPVEAASRA